MNEIYLKPKCLLFTKCEVDEFEYSFYLPNGKKVIADDCFGNILGYTECTYKNITYKNISYEYKKIGKKEVDGLCLLPMFILLFVPIFILKILKLRRVI